MAVRLKTSIALALFGALALLLVSSAPASAAFPIAKNGRIHACYKAKGKNRGALRLYRGARMRCPKKWRRVSWPARSFQAPIPGPVGPPGPAGTVGPAVEELENRINQLLIRIEQLEALIPTVTALCSQTAALTNQVDDVEEALGGLKLNAVLTTLGGVLEIPTLPGAMSAFSCPS